MRYKVALEIELDADGLLEAVEQFVNTVKDDSEFIYIVQDENNDIYSVDLSVEEDHAVLPLNKYYEPLIKNP